METIASISTEAGLFLPYILGLMVVSCVMLAIATRLVSTIVMSIGATGHFVGYVALVYFAPSQEQLAAHSSYVQLQDVIASLRFPGVGLLAVGLFVYALRELCRLRSRSGE